jgi:ribose transport system substrate-binding protein
MPTASTRRGLLRAAIACLICAFAMVSCESKESSTATPTTGPAASAGSAGGSKKPVTVAFVTNNASDFWQIAKAGVNKAQGELGVSCDFVMPDGTAADQQRLVEAEMAKNVAGMAISPIDPANQTDFLNKIVAQMPLICQDSDAPKSNRTAYVGTNNFKAGQQAGELIKQVLPNGGKVMLFVGLIDAQNAKDRADGIKDATKGTKIEIVDIRTDGTDRSKAKSNVEDTIAKMPDIGCLVGLWSYNTPAIISAVKDAKKEGKIPIVGFDEEDDTLQGVKDGYISATVVQQPFEFGYQSVKILTALARGEDAGIPSGKVIEVPTKVIKKDNVDDFWTNLKKQRGK